MEQNRLREYEARCVEEEPPFCQAACPLNVDGREVCRRLGAGDSNGALAALLRALPLPRLLTRLCEQPCQAGCKRKDLGGAIEMRALERFCVLNGAAPRPPLIPPGGKKIGVVGSGLSALTAAWDLARKGHAVTLHHSGAIGASLLSHVGPEDLAAETDALLRARVRAIPFGRPASEILDGLLQGCDAACIALDDPALASGLEERLGPIDPTTLATALPRVFAAGAASSFIDRAAQGRTAAQSILRDLQGASLTADRERRGTRLHINLQGISSVPTKLTAQDPAPEEAREEARRCLDCRCLDCVKVCTYLKYYGSYPKRYAREIYNNLSVVQGTRSANRMINSCSQCGLCAAVCPNKFDMGALCAEARDEMNRQGKMPPSAHEFALLDMEHADGPHAALFLPRSDRDGPHAGRVLFPGCQLAASDPERTAKLYEFLRERSGEDLGLWLGCCGAPALWAGRMGAFDQKRRAMEERWREAGEPELVLACSACLQTFRRHAPGMRVVSVWEVLEELRAKGVALPQAAGADRSLVLYLPCTLRDEPQIRELLRRAAEATGAGVRPYPEEEECCGYGGLQACANQDLADETAARIVERVGEETLLVGCAMCRDRFASVGARVVHVLDLIFPEGRGADSLPPRLSERRENRERLRRELLRTVWGEESEGEEGAAMELRFAPGIRERLDKRRILDEDLRRVVRNAEATGRRMVSPEGRSLACLRPRNVTTWVEYTLEGEAVRIHNAWTHRMVVQGSDFGEDRS